MEKKRLNIILFLLTILCVQPLIFAQKQGFELTSKRKKKVTLPFELIHNLIVLPLKINDSEDLFFILDTGVSTTLITEIPNGEGFSINFTKVVKLSGLGDESTNEALFSEGNEIFVKGIKGSNQDVVLLLEDSFFLTSIMGRQVNGLIGYDLFKDFIIEINYPRREIHFHDPQKFSKKYKKLKKSKKWREIPFTLRTGKPYVSAEVVQKGNPPLSVILIIDSGASHAISLYPASSDKILIPEPHIFSFLGTGISGELYGEIGRVDEVHFGDYSFEEPIVFFPQEESVKNTILFGNRNGSVGSEILRRFNIIYNYGDKSMLIRPNKYFDEPFNYNLSGIDISTPLGNFPYFVISNIREKSPAEKAGLQAGDELVELNGKSAYNYSLNELFELFEDNPDKKISLVVRREDALKKFEIILVNELKPRN